MRKLAVLCILFLGVMLPSEAQSKKPKAQVVRGNCGKRGCSEVLKTLRKTYPTYVQDFEKQCPRPKNLGLQVIADETRGQRALFNCWEAKKQKRTRYGDYLGSLPMPGNEPKFLIPLPKSAYTQELQSRYSGEIKQAQFKCGTKSGDFNFIEDKKNNSVQLQCYFTAGVVSLDENGDFVSDGEASKGAFVDEILGTFLVKTN
ncbi:MAG: hypothetical protein KME29_03410 [Calothrix sp. FI2-JRJ7]|nr:hypothetical protein [Calothrix sp. FI2-JRJ7]